MTVALTGCDRSLKAIALPDHQDISCDDYATQITPNGVLYNNVWNKQAAADQSNGQATDQQFKHQCIVKRTVNQLSQFGWSWNWPTAPRAVFGQPQIKIGASPWDPEPKFGHHLPMKISQLSLLNLAYELEVVSNGNFNIVTTMWLTSNGNPTRESITAELMIWTNYSEGQFKPAGKKQETIQLNGVEWELWTELEWSDVSGANDGKWRHVAFKLVEPKLAVNFDAKALVDYAVKRNFIDSQWYIADLELGTEVMGGQGLAWIKHFNVKIDEQPKPQIIKYNSSQH
jgi:hypothetical protein